MPKPEPKMIALDQIVSPQHVIHPCLDWVNGQLIVGVNLKGNKKAVLSSTSGLVEPGHLGSVCPQGASFQGAVSVEVAREFTNYLEQKAEDRKPVDGKNLLDDIRSYMQQFIVFPNQELPVVLASWILGTYVFPVFEAYPYLWITSAEPGCGKSSLGGLIAKLAFQGELMAAPTEAQLFHLPELSRGVQVWDEVECGEDSDKKKFNAMRPVLLNGYRNGGAVPRQAGKNFEKSVKFHVFCPRVLIGLTRLPEPALQRTIQVQLKKVSERQDHRLYIGEKYQEEETKLKERCLVWALQSVDQVNGSYQNEELRKELVKLVGPGRISDDIWLPLFAVTAAAGGGERSGLNSLRDAAKQTEIASRTKVVEPQPPARDVHAEEEKRKQVLDTAINLLRLSGTRMTPEELAKKVGITLGFEVTTQSLSKGLAKRGIRTKKVKGRRVFAFAGIAHRVARRARSSSRLRRTARTRGRQKRGNGEAQLSESSYSL